MASLARQDRVDHTGQPFQGVHVSGDPLGVHGPEQVGQPQGEQLARRHLGVERLGGGHGHFHVAPVGGVDIGVGLLHQGRVAPVDDAVDPCAPVAAEVHHPVGVRGGAGLGDRDQQHVVHGFVAHEADELAAGVGLDGQAAALEGAAHELGHGHGRHRSRSLAHADDAGERGLALCHALDQGRAVAEPLGQEGDRAVFAQVFAVQGVAHRGGRLVDFLLDIVGVRAPENVAGEYLDLLLLSGTGSPVSRNRAVGTASAGSESRSMTDTPPWRWTTMGKEERARAAMP